MRGRSTFLACGKLIGVSHDHLSNALPRSQGAPLVEQVGRDARYRRILARRHRAALRRKKLDIAIERFELNPGESDIVRFLNEHADE
jgi:hypothetical protein